VQLSALDSLAARTYAEDDVHCGQGLAVDQCAWYAVISLNRLGQRPWVVDSANPERCPRVGGADPGATSNTATV